MPATRSQWSTRKDRSDRRNILREATAPVSKRARTPKASTGLCCCPIKICLNSTPSITATALRPAVFPISQNYVIQVVIEDGRAEDKTNLGPMFARRLSSVRIRKLADCSLTKSWHLLPSQRPTPIVTMMEDQYGSYVLQRVLRVAEGDQKESLINTIRPQLMNMRRYSNSKHLTSTSLGTDPSSQSVDPSADPLFSSSTTSDVFPVETSQAVEYNSCPDTLQFSQQPSSYQADLSNGAGVYAPPPGVVGSWLTQLTHLATAMLELDAAVHGGNSSIFHCLGVSPSKKSFVPGSLGSVTDSADVLVTRSPRRVKREAGGLREVREIIRRELELQD
ncbi:hypothetical protein B0H14DRAFT_2588280 [Mycena olivaceomarginata]|nr:hypothetical protein B0H14DRAFT_2588280 [Mycena olivaceomarginata]